MASPKTLTGEETEELLNYFRLDWRTELNHRKGIRNYTIALLMLDAGLRVGEVVQMRFYDLYFNSEPVTSITIPAGIAKNKTERIIPVSERLTLALLKHYPAVHELRNAPDPRYVFHHGQPHHPLTTRQVERIIRAAAMKSLGRPIHPHVLRHTFASRLMRKTNARVVQELLGHKHLTSTQVYTHPNGEDLRQAIDGIDDDRAKLAQHGIEFESPSSAANGLDAPGTDGHVR